MVAEAMLGAAGAARTTPVASLAAAASGLTPLDSVMLKVI